MADPGAGELRERVTVQQPTTTTDAQKGRATTWGTLAASLPAKVVPLSARERIQSAALGAQQVYTVLIRYRADVTTKMRLSWTPYKATAAKTLQIHGAQPHEGRRVFLNMSCSEVI